MNLNFHFNRSWLVLILSVQVCSSIGSSKVKEISCWEGKHDNELIFPVLCNQKHIEVFQDLFGLNICINECFHDSNCTVPSWMEEKCNDERPKKVQSHLNQSKFHQENSSSSTKFSSFESFILFFTQHVLIFSILFLLQS